MKVALIAAVAGNGAIGRGGGLPWRLPADLRQFKQRTTGHAVIMGRRTFETFDAPLPDRRTIVLSRDPGYRPDGAEVARSLDDALRMAEASGEPEAFVAGGAKVYAEALPRADRLYLTVVHAEVDGDTFFPAWDPAQWTLVEQQHHPADERHQYAFTFRIYERR